MCSFINIYGWRNGLQSLAKKNSVITVQQYNVVLVCVVCMEHPVLWLVDFSQCTHPHREKIVSFLSSSWRYSQTQLNICTYFVLQFLNVAVPCSSKLSIAFSKRQTTHDVDGKYFVCVSVCVCVHFKSQYYISIRIKYNVYISKIGIMR